MQIIEAIWYVNWVCCEKWRAGNDQRIKGDKWVENYLIFLEIVMRLMVFLRIYDELH